MQASILQPSECAKLPAVAGAASAHLTSMSPSKEEDDALWLNASTPLSSEALLGFFSLKEYG